MASGGGARAWQFLRLNLEFREAFEARPQAASAFEDPFASDGPASPFWSICCMQHIDQDVAVPIMLR